jgi:hypothetical protein
MKVVSSARSADDGRITLMLSALLTPLRVETDPARFGCGLDTLGAIRAFLRVDIACSRKSGYRE